jgi:putative ABC transport system permease protein
VLTSAGVCLGVAAMVASVGIAASAGGAVSERFDAVRATLVSVRLAAPARPDPAAVAAVRRLPGVVDAGGVCWSTAGVEVTRLPPAGGAAPVRVNAVAASPPALAVFGVGPVRGRPFDEGHVARGEAVALVDTVAARVLDVGVGMSVFADGRLLTVIGVFTAPTGETRLTGSLVVPDSLCAGPAPVADFDQSEVVVRTRPGAADQVGYDVPLALDPVRPESLAVLVPPDLRTLRQGVERDTRALLLGLAGVCLLIGVLGVSNTMVVAVLERRAEIGLRRAIGATRSDVAVQFLAESVLLGTIGGVLGLVLGLDATAVVCLVQGWVIELDPRMVGLGPLVGVLVGLAAGAYPAYAAARVAPAAALRG